MSTLLSSIFLLVSTAAISATLSDNAIYSRLNTQQRLDFKRCLGSNKPTAEKACRSLARANHRNLSFLETLGERLEKSNRYADAVTVYNEGLKLLENRATLDRKRSLALSNLQEIQSSTSATNYTQNEVAAKLDAIKCMRLKTQDAIPACQRAVANDPGDVKLLSRLDKILVLAGNSDNKQEAQLAQGSQSDQQQIGTESDAHSLAAKLELLNDLRKSQLISKSEYKQRKQTLLDQVFNTSDTVVASSDKPAKKLSTEQPLLRGVDIGNYYALVIGSNDYSQFPQLETAINDASAVSKVLENNYGFKVRTLRNATRYDIMSELSRLRETLSENDNLLVFYAGHGILDKATARGYWLPVDAEENNYANWLSTTDVTDALKGMRSKHVMVVADSCYSGSLSRGENRIKRKSFSDRRALLTKLSRRRSRTVLSSGGLEPVLDSGGGNNSIFTSAFLNALENNSDVIEANAVFSQIREHVVKHADQTPEYREIRKAGHNGGDFIFSRIRT